MQLSVTAVAALAALLVICGCAQARPDGVAPTDAPAEATTARDSGSREADVDSSSGEEENMTAQGKVAMPCAPRQPELLALEAECAHSAEHDHSECSSTPAPMAETTTEEVAAEAAAAAAAEAEGNIAATEAAATATTEAPPTTDSAPKQARRQKKRSCNYHLCVLKKLEVLDSSDMPDKMLITNWIANNVTDEKQKERLQQRFAECVSTLKDIFGESSENSKSVEEETSEDKKMEETQPKKKSCVTAKKVISCLSKSVECPVLKF